MLELLVSHGESFDQPLSLYKAKVNPKNNYLRIKPLNKYGAPARGATVTLISLYLMSIFPNKRNMLILGNIITYILIIASKNHYTIDVLIGSYVSTTLYFLRDKILI